MRHRIFGLCRLVGRVRWRRPGLVGRAQGLRRVRHGRRLRRLLHHRLRGKLDCLWRRGILEASGLRRSSHRPRVRGCLGCIRILSGRVLDGARLRIRYAGRVSLCRVLVVLRRSLGLLDVSRTLVGREIGVVAHGYGFASLTGRHVLSKLLCNTLPVRFAMEICMKVRGGQ
jgi:hypothetical protein